MTEEMKETWNLPVNFFKENPLDTPVTAGHLLHFQMQTLMDDDIDDILNRAVVQNFSNNRRNQYLAEQDAMNAKISNTILTDKLYGAIKDSEMSLEELKEERLKKYDY